MFKYKNLFIIKCVVFLLDLFVLLFDLFFKMNFIFREIFNL